MPQTYSLASQKDNMVMKILMLGAIGWIVFGLIISFTLDFLGITGFANSALTMLILFLLLMLWVDKII
jgi:hypothetical protein